MSNATHIWAFVLENNGTWVPLGTPKTPQTPPLSIQLSLDASTIVVRRLHTFNQTFTAVAAYRWDGTDYKAVGKRITVTASWEREVSFGINVDGNTVAVGDSTQIQIFSWDESDYILTSQINVSDTSQLSIAGGAKRLAVLDGKKGVIVYHASNNIFQNETGWIAYRLNVTNVLLSSISKDGTKVVCVVPQYANASYATNANAVVLHEYRSPLNAWIQLGNKFLSNNTITGFDMAVNGQTIALQSDEKIQIISYQDGEWGLIGQFDDSDGKAVSLSYYSGELFLAGIIANQTIVLRREDKIG